MAIEKNNFKVSRFDPEFSPNGRELMSSDEDELPPLQPISAVESDDNDDVGDEEEDDDDDDDEFNDADSGAGSDDFDLLELGETGAEFCQIGSLTCSVPFELYDLSGLEDILSVDVWNEVLTEEEKFSLTKYLPDLDEYTFMRTLKDLLEGSNFHFGSPIKKLFEMLKGGLCEPRVALYREGLNFFQKRQHYHVLRKHQNTMVSSLCQIRDAWLNCRGYSIEEKLRVLNIMKSQKSLMYEKMEEDLESDSSEKVESGDGLWGKRVAKDRKSGMKLGRNSAYGVGSNMEYAPQVPLMGLEVGKHGKQNPKGILKLAGARTSSNELMGRFPPGYHGIDMAPRPYGSSAAVSRHNKVVGYGLGEPHRLRDHMIMDDDDGAVEEALYGLGQNMSRSSAVDKSGFIKGVKKHDRMRNDDLPSDSLLGLPFSSKNDLHAYARNRNVNQLTEVKVFAAKPPNIRNFHDYDKPRYSENLHQFAVGDQMKSMKGRSPQLPPESSRVDLSDPTNPIWHSKSHGQVFSVDNSTDWNSTSKKWKSGRESPDLNFKAYRGSSPQVDDRILLSELRKKPSKEKIRSQFVQNGGQDKGALKANGMYLKNEETESDSSEQFDDDDDDDEDFSPLTRTKSAYPIGIMEGSRSSFVKSGLDAKKASSGKKELKRNAVAFDGISHFSKKVTGFSEHGNVAAYSSKAKQKSKMRNSSPLHKSGSRVSEDNSMVGLGNLKDDDDSRRIPKLGKNGQLRGEFGERLPISSLRGYPTDRKQKGGVSHDYIIHGEDSFETRLLADEIPLSRLGKKGQGNEGYHHDRRERSDSSLIGCNLVTKKRKAKEDVMDMVVRDEDTQQQIDDSISVKKKGKKKLEADSSTLEMETFEPPVKEAEAVIVEVETKPQKKLYTPITPTVHTGFSFSVVHLLSAVRMAMITPLTEDTLEVAKPKEEQNKAVESGTNGAASSGNLDVNVSDDAAQVDVPVLTVQEIVNRVRSNPGDPCILETQEPLQDLVRGVLRIFSSKTAPLGIKGWKPLVAYEKSTKSWSWVGPIPHSSTDHDGLEEVTSPEYWGLPHKSLVKLVDSFANWLKSGQETLQQIGSLPAPPVSLMQCNLDEKERFRDLRAQKSLNTISPSSEEVRTYFRKEEVLRYSIPDRAFSYTAADGKKSIVAPLRRCGGKPTSKARDHFMLKRDRPPHVTILCLVRDAASRLPGSIGTRADVCTLIRDSQYIVEDVSDAQVNQVVSGALDRLHYERDPCVQFDGERKLWVYLHREREEEDFEDDGTSSTKKWKRQKKDPADQPAADQAAADQPATDQPAVDQPDHGTVTVAFHGAGDQDQPGFDLGSDLNADPPGNDDDRGTDIDNDVRQNVEDNIDMSHGSEQGNRHQGESMVWEGLGLNPLPEDKLPCQENSTNDDFDDETFSRERPAGLLSASLL